MLVSGRIAGFFDVREQFCDVLDSVSDHGRIEIRESRADQIVDDGIRFTDPAARFPLDRTLSGRDEVLVELSDSRFEIGFGHRPTETARQERRFAGTEICTMDVSFHFARFSNPRSTRQLQVAYWLKMDRVLVRYISRKALVSLSQRVSRGNT